jgi:HK97 family phage major capsid protein
MMSKALLNTLHTAYRVDFEAAKALVERAAGEKRDLSAEEEGQYSRLNESMNAKMAKIEDIQKSEDRAVKIAALAETVEVATGKTIDNDADLLRAVLTGERRSANFDLRALATATATTPVSFADFVVEQLVDGNTVYEGASKIRTTDIRNLTIPVVAGTAPAAGFVGQGGTITASDPVFSSLTLGAFNAATLTLASRELVDSAGFNLVEYVGRAAGRQIAYLAGSACTIGTGTAEPTGFITALNAASKTTTAVKGGTAAVAATFFSATDLASVLYALAPSYRNPNTVWHVSTGALSKIRQLQDTTGQFILQPSVAAGQPETLLGYRLKENVYMAAVANASKSVALLHEPSYYIREAGGVEVAQSADRYFELNSIGIRTMYHFDANLPDTNAGRILVSAAS